ncbi:MAG: hypothetical protein JRI34_00470 [Deltaproteobacteria bacterium]|nr:hypothetical protein [Deltaproteobacteria bacterium]
MKKRGQINITDFNMISNNYQRTKCSFDGVLPKVTGLPVNPQNPAAVSVALTFPASYSVGAKYYQVTAN